MRSSIYLRGGMDKRRCAVVLMCLATGILLVPVDSAMEPYLAQLGRIGSVDAVEDLWKELASTFGIALFLLAGASSLTKDRGRALLAFAACVTVSGTVEQAAKYLIGRARPNYVHDQTLFYGPFSALHPVPGIQIDSMPSGHTAVAFAMAVALAWRWPRLAFLWYSLAAGVAVSRVLADVHFPSDVIVGACIGLVIGWVICAQAFFAGIGPLGSRHQGKSEGLPDAEERENTRDEEEVK